MEVEEDEPEVSRGPSRPVLRPGARPPPVTASPSTEAAAPPRVANISAAPVAAGPSYVIPTVLVLLLALAFVLYVALGRSGGSKAVALH